MLGSLRKSAAKQQMACGCNERRCLGKQPLKKHTQLCKWVPFYAAYHTDTLSAAKVLWLLETPPPPLHLSVPCEL